VKQKGGVHQRRTRFIKEYLIDQNATRAAIAAGFSQKGARVQGSRLLADPNISAQIDEQNAKTNQKYDLTVERIKQEIARLCYYDPAEYWNANGTAKAMHEISEDARRAIAGFECAELFEGSGEERSQAGYIKKFKLMDKNKALETAARCMKMLTDRVEVTGMDALAEELAKARKRRSV
jgi:phage terminase small subunit